MRRFPFFVDTWINGERIGSQRISDPLIHTTVVISVRDMIKSVFKGRPIKVVVNVHGDRDTWKPLSDLRQSLPEEMPPPVRMEGAYESQGGVK